MRGRPYMFIDHDATVAQAGMSFRQHRLTMTRFIDFDLGWNYLVRWHTKATPYMEVGTRVHLEGELSTEGYITKVKLRRLESEKV